MEDTFINKVSDDEAAFVIKCYQYLLVLGVIKTKAEYILSTKEMFISPLCAG